MYKNKYVCLNKAIWLTTMKMRLEMKNRSHKHKYIDLGLDVDTNILNTK